MFNFKRLKIQECFMHLKIKEYFKRERDGLVDQFNARFDSIKNDSHPKTYDRYSSKYGLH